MAITSLKGQIPYPIHPNINIAGGVPNVASYALDSTSDRVGNVLQVPKDGNISQILVAVGTVAGAGGSVTVDGRIETINNTTGFPTGTLWASNTNGSFTATNTEDNVWKTITLTSSASVVMGDYIGVVMNPTSFTTVTSIQFVTFNDNQLFTCYSVQDITGAGYSKTQSPHTFIIGYDDGSYEPVTSMWPFLSIGTVTFNSSSGTPKVGAKITIPCPMRISGAWIYLNPTATTNNFDVKLYDSDGTTVLASISMDANILSGTGVGIYYITFSSYYDAATGDVLYLSVEPTTTNNISIYRLTVSSNAALDGVAGGKDIYYTTNNGSSWTDTTDSRPLLGLLVEGFSDGAGGSAGNVGYGFAG